MIYPCHICLENNDDPDIPSIPKFPGSPQAFLLSAELALSCKHEAERKMARIMESGEPPLKALQVCSSQTINVGFHRGSIPKWADQWLTPN